MIYAHELEHSLQTYRLGNGYEIGEDEYSAIQTNDAFKFHGEKHAMLAEWFFLHHAPDTLRNRSLELLSEAPNFDKRSEDSLQWASLSSEKYLENQWQFERYSRKAIEEPQSKHPCHDMLFKQILPKTE